MRYIVVGGVVLLLLTVTKGLFSNSLEFLPLGGSSVAELGIIFGLAVSAATLDELWKGKANGKAENNRNDRS